MYKKGTFIERFSALIIDLLIILVPLSLLTDILYLFEKINININQFEIIILFTFIIYNTLFIWKSGTTIGKRIFKLKVVNNSYKPVGFWKALLRESFGKIISSILNLGYFWMLIDKKKQTFHDKFARTLIVKVDENKKLIPTHSEEKVSIKQKIIFAILFLLFGFPIAAISALLFVYLFIARPFVVSGKAMAPNYNNGQYLMATMFDKNIKRGDVIVLKPPFQYDVVYIKRVVGLPGEKISINNKKVYINDSLLDESSYLISFISTYGSNFLNEKNPKVIPKDNYVVLGDNREYSSDSRNWGFVPKKNVIGKIAFCYYNCSEEAFFK